MERDETPAGWTSLALLERFRVGDERAAEALFSRYFERLTLLARSRLSPRLACRTDPEDIVRSVYRSFFVGARAGRFTLSRGGDLWRLRAPITKHKLLRAARHHSADRRSVDRELPLDRTEETMVLGRQPEPTPEDALALADELEWVLSRLDVFGRRVRELLGELLLSEIRKLAGKSRREVAEVRGIKQPSLSKLEKQSDMQISTLRRIVEALGGKF